MKQVVEKLRVLERELSKEKGPFSLFALFLRDGAPNVWDLVVAADWIDRDQGRALREISKRIQNALATDEVTKLSRVVIIDNTNPELQSIASTLRVKHGLSVVKDSDFFGLAIKEGFIITSRLRKAA